MVDRQSDSPPNDAVREACRTAENTHKTSRYILHSKAELSADHHRLRLSNYVNPIHHRFDVVLDNVRASGKDC